MNIDKKLMDQIIRFVFVGLTAFIIDASILMILTNTLSVHYLIAGVLSFTISCLFNYICSILWVFGKSNQSRTKEIICFFILSVIGLAIQSFLLYLGVDVLKFPLLFTKIAATGIVMVFNFITRKLLLS